MGGGEEEGPEGTTFPEEEGEEEEEARPNFSPPIFLPYTACIELSGEVNERGSGAGSALGPPIPLSNLSGCHLSDTDTDTHKRRHDGNDCKSF